MVPICSALPVVPTVADRIRDVERHAPEDLPVLYRLLKAVDTPATVPVRGRVAITEERINVLHQYAWDSQDDCRSGALSYREARDTLLRLA